MKGNPLYVMAGKQTDIEIDFKKHTNKSNSKGLALGRSEPEHRNLSKEKYDTIIEIQKW